MTGGFRVEHLPADGIIVFSNCAGVGSRCKEAEIEFIANDYTADVNDSLGSFGFCSLYVACGI